jgi:hypothetical protein
MKSIRSLSEHEKAIITAMLQNKNEFQYLLDSLDNVFVAEMDDGGMGSLQLVPNGLENVDRSMGKQVALGEFIDSDEVPVSVALNVDRQGGLYELDIWKVDFSPLLSWPSPSVIKIVEPSG